MVIGLRHVGEWESELVSMFVYFDEGGNENVWLWWKSAFMYIDDHGWSWKEKEEYFFNPFPFTAIRVSVSLTFDFR